MILFDGMFDGVLGVCRVVRRRLAAGVPGPPVCPLIIQLSAFGTFPIFDLDRMSQINIALSRPPVAKHVGSNLRNAAVFTERLCP